MKTARDGERFKLVACGGCVRKRKGTRGWLARMLGGQSLKRKQNKAERKLQINQEQPGRWHNEELSICRMRIWTKNLFWSVSWKVGFVVPCLSQADVKVYPRKPWIIWSQTRLPNYRNWVYILQWMNIPWKDRHKCTGIGQGSIKSFHQQHLSNASSIPVHRSDHPAKLIRMTRYSFHKRHPTGAKRTPGWPRLNSIDGISRKSNKIKTKRHDKSGIRTHAPFETRKSIEDLWGSGKPEPCALDRSAILPIDENHAHLWQYQGESLQTPNQFTTHYVADLLLNHPKIQL